MRRALRWAGYLAAGSLAAAILPLACLSLAFRTDAGRAWLAEAITAASGGKAFVAGLAGTFPAEPRAGRIELRDGRGTWLTMDDARMDWSPWRLLAGRLAISTLEAGRIRLERAPEYPPSPPSSSGVDWPIRAEVNELRARLELAEPVLGIAAALSAEGAARLASSREGEARLELERLDGEGAYRAEFRFDAASLRSHLSLREPAHGLASRLAGLPDLGDVDIEASLDGPTTTAAVHSSLTAGPLRASVEGVLNLENRSADLRLQAEAPAMQPRPELSWNGVELRASARGDFVRPQVEGELRIEDLRAAGAGVHRIEARVQGDAGALKLNARLDNLRMPGPKPELFQAAPATLTAKIRLDTPERPASFELKHPLFSLQGHTETAGAPNGELELRLPDLAPFAGLAKLDARGNALARLQAATVGEGVELTLAGRLNIAGGAAPWPELLGAASLDAALSAKGKDFELSRLTLKGKNLSLAVAGGMKDGKMDFAGDIALPKLAAISSKLSGELRAHGRLQGAPEDFGLTVDAEGKAGGGDWPPAPLSAKFQAQGLPRRAPEGTMTARAALEGAPLEMDLKLRPDAHGGAKLSILRVDWKSAHAAGAMNLAQGASMPEGKLELRVAKLQDFARWLGRGASGVVAASLELEKSKARVQMDVQKLAWNAVSAQRARLNADIADPAGAHPALTGALTLEDCSAGSLAGGARLNARGPIEAVQLDLTGAAPALAARLNALALLDARARRLDLSEARVDIQGETLRLLAPARIDFAAGLALDRLRLGWRQSALEAAGSVVPKLDLNANLHVPANDLAQAFLRGARAEGALDAEAHLAGSLEHPAGRATVEGENLRALDGPAQGLPPARLKANAALAGEGVDVNASLDAGPKLSLTLAGRAPLSAEGSLDIQARGTADLSLSDPWLTAAGQRARGQVDLAGAIAGSPAAPRVNGVLRLARGEALDEILGARLEDIQGTLRLDGRELRIETLEGKAGEGRLAVQGHLDAGAPGFPLDLQIKAQQAQALSGDRFSVNLNADLEVKGEARGALAAAGSIHVNRADIRIPERIPARVAVLNVRVPGAPSPLPPRPGPKIGLDVKVRAPGEIFVRGRGVDAELGGVIEAHGTADDPQPSGAFEMRRGQFSLAGQTLTFSKGEVGLNGGKLTDPSLDFVATTARGNVTASLTVGGTASKPKITLSGEPELPQDEVLAQLLFGRGAANLGPLELAQIGAALVSLSGAASGVGNPLETVRKTLALDRLSVGSDKSGAAKVEGGRYVAPGVYLGAQQGFSGAQTQGVVQVDVGRHLKLEGALGNAAPASSRSGAGSVGLRYEYEY
jgi:translocation and assembly module TamB